MIRDSLQKRLQEMELENPSVNRERVAARGRVIDTIYGYLRRISFVVREVPQKEGIYSKETEELFERTDNAKEGFLRTKGKRLGNLYRAYDIAQELQYDFSIGEFGEVTDYLLNEFLNESESASKNNLFTLAISDADRAYEMTDKLGTGLNKKQIYSSVISEMIRYVGENSRGGYFTLATSTADKAHDLIQRVGLDTTTEQIYGKIARELIKSAENNAREGYFTLATSTADKAHDLIQRVGLDILEQEIYQGVVSHMIKSSRKYGAEEHHALESSMLNHAQKINLAHKRVFDPLLSTSQI